MDNFWNTYPYTDYQKINLDYMLEKFPEFEQRIKALEDSENPESVSSIYWVTYGTTSFSDISTALADGKFLVLKDGNNYGILNAVFPVNISFFRMSGGIVYNYIINDITGWATYTVEYVTTQSPHFSGIPTAPTAASGTNSAQIATTAFVKNAIDNIPAGGELSTAVKQALLQLAQKVAYIDNQGQTYYQDLYNALYNITPVELVSISAVYTQSGTVYDTDSLESLKSDLVVTATYSDSSTAIIPSTDYTLSGTLIAGSSTITISYEGKTDTFTVTVTAGVTLVSISAVYTQSGTVYDTDSLESLKSDLVVTATYSDSSTAVIPTADYTLSGTLTSGTSTITVSYSGQTTTFNVTVTAAPASYIAVGNPSISNGILTVTEGNFIKTSDVFSPGTSAWKATCKYRFTSVPSGSYSDIFGSVNSENASVNGFLLEFTNVDRRTASLFSSSDGTSWNITTTGSGRLSTLPTDAATAWVWVEIEFTGSAYVVRYSLDGSQYTQALNYASTDTLYGGFAVAYGLKRNGALPGEIDLNECKIYVGGELWWKAI